MRWATRGWWCWIPHPVGVTPAWALFLVRAALNDTVQMAQNTPGASLVVFFFEVVN